MIKSVNIRTLANGGNIMNDINLGIQLMGFGILGTFTVLILFYFIIKILMKVFPYKSDEQ